MKQHALLCQADLLPVPNALRWKPEDYRFRLARERKRRRLGDPIGCVLEVLVSRHGQYPLPAVMGYSLSPAGAPEGVHLVRDGMLLPDNEVSLMSR